MIREDLLDSQDVRELLMWHWLEWSLSRYILPAENCRKARTTPVYTETAILFGETDSSDLDMQIPCPHRCPLSSVLTCLAMLVTFPKLACILEVLVIALKSCCLLWYLYRWSVTDAVECSGSDFLALSIYLPCLDWNPELLGQCSQSYVEYDESSSSIGTQFLQNIKEMFLSIYV